ncbi:MAG: enoyl-CoA hydratase/isomerase family protein [Actinobacteria bacterium]|nr:enoyl-CoA hydratase/isomerase family protein [Actinomycetota bacterium]
MTAETVRLERDGDVAVLTLDRPERHNAFTDAMDDELFAAWERLHDDRSVRAIVWRGEGPSFSSGRDTEELGQRPDGVSDLDYIARGHRYTRLLLTMPAPVVVALKGWVIGGSFERALLCDLRIAADDARMMLPEVKHGVIPDSAGVARLFQMAGHGVAADLALTGRVMDADEALRHGVVSRVTAVEELDEVALEIAHTIAAFPPLAVRMAMQTVRGLANPPVEDTLTHEMLAQTVVMAGDEFRARREARDRS